MSKCRVCRGPAIIDLPRHNAHFCAEHLQQLCRRQVEKAIDQFDMLRAGERVLVAGSTLRWNLDARSRQRPVLPVGRGFPRKVKPLVRLTELEIAAWCVVRGIDYEIDECPLTGGNRHLDHKAVLNELEARSPGAKAALYLSFFDNIAPLLASTRAAVVESLSRCSRCGAPTTGSGLGGAQQNPVCAFCRLLEVASVHEPVSIEVLRPAKARRARG